MPAEPGRLIQMLEDVVKSFSNLKIPHAIAGGLALAAHGLPRAISGVEFLIDQEGWPLTRKKSDNFVQVNES